MEKVIDLNSHNNVPRKGISWRAIFAGVICILSIVFLLNLLGLVFGFGTINPTEESNPMSGVGTGSLIWWIVSNLIALFAGGYVAARVGASFYNKSGMIQGIMTWALYTFISAWLLTSAVGSIISGVGNTIGNVLSGGGQEQSQQQQQAQQQQTQQQQNRQLNLSLEQVKSKVYGLLEDTDKQALDPDRLENKVEEVTNEAQNTAQSGSRRPGQMDNQVEQIFSNAKNEFDNTFEALDKQALVNVITERTNMTEAEARRSVDNYSLEYDNLQQQSEQFLQNVGQQAQQTAGNIAQGIADAALYLFIALVIGLIVAALGGVAGVKSLRTDYADSHYIRENSVDYDRGRADLTRGDRYGSTSRTGEGSDRYDKGDRKDFS